MSTDENYGDCLHRSGFRDPGGYEDPFHDSAVVPMFTDKQLDSAVTELRCMLEEDQSVRTQEALKGEMARQIQSVAQSFPNGHWFQRIDYPSHHITSTSNHELAHIDGGGLNTLGSRLSGREASILRPWPKWSYL